MRSARRHGFTAHEIHNTDIAFLQYTGGTTGVAKGAILTHRNLLANLQQVGYWLASACKEGEEVALTALPLYHIFSLTATLSFTQFAANMVLITNPARHRRLAKECAKWDFSIIVGVNTLFTAMLNNKIFCAHKFTRLKVTAGGGSQVQRTIAERWKQQTGCNILEAYGLTECSPGVCGNIPEAPWDGSVGVPIPVDRSIHPRQKASATSAVARRPTRFPNTQARSACAARRSCRATGTSPRRRPPFFATAGCARATWATWT